MNELDRILIVDDDREIRDLLVGRLKTYGFDARAVENGADMLSELETGSYALVILDIMLQGEDGLELCRRLRSSECACPDIPVIFLSALNETADRIVGLEFGGDDYLPKPFETRELVARIKAVLRRFKPNGTGCAEPAAPEEQRSHGPSAAVLAFGSWKLNTASRNLIDSSGLIVSLSAAEYRLLAFFLDHPQTVLTRESLMEHTAFRSPDVYDRSLDAQISRLRAKLRDNARNPEIIKTMRGDGYMLATPVIRERMETP